MNPDFTKVCCYDFEDGKGFLYATSSINNAIIKITDKKEAVVIFQDDRYPSGKPAMWSRTAHIGNLYAFSPCYSNRIVIIDSLKDEPVCVKEVDGLSDEIAGFWQIATSDNAFYFLGFQYPGIIKLDIETNELKYITDWTKQIYNENDYDEQNDFYFGDGFAQYGSVYYFPVGKKSVILKLDTDSDEVELIKIMDEDMRFYGMSQDGDDIWCTDADSGKIIVWNRISKIANIIDTGENIVWRAPIFHNESVYLFPLYVGGKIIRISKESYTSEIFEPLNDLLFEDGKHKYDVMAVRQNGDYVTMIRIPDCTWLSYNYISGDTTSEEYSIVDKKFLEALRKEFYDDILKDAISASRVIGEADMPLEEFIRRI